MLKNFKIRTKLIIMPLVFFCAVGALGFFGYGASKNILISEIETSSLSQAQSIMNEVDILMHRSIHNIESIADNKILTDETRAAEEIDSYLKRQREFYHFFDSFSYFNIDRIRIADTDGIGISNQHPMEGFWHDIYDGKVSAGSDIRIGPERQIPVIYFAAPVKSGSTGQIIGAVVARFSMSEINTILTMKMNTEHSHSTLFTKDRDVLFSNCPYYKDKILKEKITTDLPFVKEVLNKNDGVVHGYDIIHKFDAINAYVYEKGFEDFSGNNWSLVITTDENVALNQLAVLRKIAFGIALTTVFLALVVMFFLSRLISKPIRELSQTAQAITKGGLTKRAEIKSNDEIGQLAYSFNQMTDSLIKTTEAKRKTEVAAAAAAAAAARLEAIEEGKKYIENIMTVMPTSLIVITPQAKIESVNPITLEILGYKEKELIGQPIDKILGAAAAAAEENIFKGAGLEKLIEKGTIKDERMMYLTKKGEEIPVAVSGSVTRDEKGKLQYIVVVAKDLREIKKYAAERLAKITPVLQKVSMGDFSENIEVPEKEDEFTEHLVALNLTIDDLRETVGKNVELVKALEKEKAGLEEKVKERTQDIDAANQQLRAANQQMNAANQQLAAAQKNLQDKLLELERFNKVAVGRELKMVELKEEIARLKGNKTNEQ